MGHCNFEDDSSRFQSTSPWHKPASHLSVETARHKHERARKQLILSSAVISGKFELRASRPVRARFISFKALILMVALAIVGLPSILSMHLGQDESPLPAQRRHTNDSFQSMRVLLKAEGRSTSGERLAGIQEPLGH